MRTSSLSFIALTSVLALTACFGSTGGGMASSSSSSSESSVASSAASEVILLTPEAGSTVASPLKISAKAPGTWFFEASIPVLLTDADGNVLAQTTGQVEGGWMTVDLVKFDAELTFTTTAKSGYIVIKNDNPSGLPENDKSVKFPVHF